MTHDAAAPAGPSAEASAGTAGRAGTVAVIANPVARGFSRWRLGRFLAALESGGRRADLRLTGGPGDATAIAHSLPDDVTTVVAASGDGTIREVAAGLLDRVGTVPVLAVLPCGTANVLACELGLPRDPAESAAVVLAGRTAVLHPGLAGDRPFLLMASAGFDARVVAGVGLRLKRRLGAAAFALVAGRLLLAGRVPSFAGSADGRPFAAGIAIAAKAGRYGGRYRLTRETAATRPGLRLVTVADARPATLFGMGVRLLLDRLDRAPAREDRAADEIRFDTPGVPLQLDGDAAGETPVVIRPSGRTLVVAIP